jgi:transposase
MSVSSSAGVGRRRRRLWSEAEKRRIVAETLERGASVSVVARRHDVNANLLFTWRRKMGAGVVASAGNPISFIPAVIDAAPVAPAAPPPGGRIEIVLAGGDRVIVDAAFDGAALDRVVDILSRR